LLSVLAFVYYATAAPVTTTEQKAKINCLIEHLKEQGKLNAAFPKYPTESDATDRSSCVSTVASVKREFLTLLVNPVLDKISEQEKECFFDDSISHDFVSYAMLTTVYEEEELIPQTERVEKFMEAKKKSFAGMFKPTFKCLSDEFYGSSFDDGMKPENNDYNDEQFYCMRKFVVENNLSDTNIYNISVNTKSLDNTGCDNFMKMMINEGERRPINGMDRIAEACIAKKISESGIAQKKVFMKVLSKLEMTEEQKQNERKNFIKYSKEFAKQMLTCLP
jgi:hypothetical protein